MNLHGISIEHWKNIGRLELNELDAPLVVLHGPNRTGKSSIVQAVRCCLFDYDHDSSSADIRNAVPWNTQSTPEVTVEFETAGQRYRLMKRFSSRKDGDALLKQRTSAGDWNDLQRAKEAAHEARTLLGCTKSDEGLNQLLWLPQGQTTLPDPRQLDQSVRKRFEDVLGSLLTARDVEFHDLLQQECKQYFSLKTGKELKRSPVVELRGRLEEAHERAAKLTNEVKDSESLVSEYDELQGRLNDERHRITRSRKLIAELENANETVDKKRRALEGAQRNLETAQQQLHQAEELLAKHSKLREELVELDGANRKTEAALNSAAESRQKIAAEITNCKEALQDVRDRLQKLDNGRSELEDKRRLLELAEEDAQLAETLKECSRLETELNGLQKQLGELLTPDEKIFKTLQTNRRDAARLQAEIDAAALQLEIETAADNAVQLSLDTDAAQAVELTSGEVSRWQFRQSMQLNLESFGRVRVVRGEQNVSLDESARQLQRLQTEFADALASFNISPDDEQWLEKLSTRKHQRVSLTDKINEQRQRLSVLSPDGVETLRQERERIAANRTAVLERRPELADWTPDAEQLRDAESTLNSQSQELRNDEGWLSQQWEELQKQDNAARDMHQEHQNDLSTMRGEKNGLERQLAELGDEFTLKQNVKAAGKRAAEAQTQVKESALSPEEERLQEELEQEHNALQNREGRQRELEKQAHGIQVILRERAGLHEELAEAEAETERLQTQLQREERTAAAHRLLLDTFENCREQRVQRTLGPLEDRLMEWTARLGLSDYAAVDFGKNDYLPSGLKREDSEALVALAEESFGTVEQMSLLIRLAAGNILAKGERHVAILDDPLTHADPAKHRAMLAILEEVTQGDSGGNGDGSAPLQLLIFTCHPERFDHLRNAKHINLVERIERHSSA